MKLLAGAAQFPADGLPRRRLALRREKEKTANLANARQSRDGRGNGLESIVVVPYYLVILRRRSTCVSAAIVRFNEVRGTQSSVGMHFPRESCLSHRASGTIRRVRTKSSGDSQNSLNATCASEKCILIRKLTSSIHGLLASQRREYVLSAL